MKKIILLLAVLLMTAPALAEVIVTVTPAPDDSGWATIAYDANGASDFIRAFALDITTDGNNIVEIDSVSTDYWVFPGTIDINDAGGVNDVGSPIAPNGSPGALGGLGTSGITIEMGALFEDGVDPAPGATGTLLRIRVEATSDVCVVGNAMRGKVVMKDASSHEPVSACATVTVGSACCPGDSDCDVDMDLTDYYTMQGNLAFADYLQSSGAGTHYVIPQGDPVVGFLYNPNEDTNSDLTVDLTDYYTLQGWLAFADYLATGGAGTYYYISPTDPLTSVVWPCP